MVLLTGPMFPPNQTNLPRQSKRQKESYRSSHQGRPLEGASQSGHAGNSAQHRRRDSFHQRVKPKGNRSLPVPERHKNAHGQPEGGKAGGPKPGSAKRLDEREDQASQGHPSRRGIYAETIVVGHAVKLGGLWAKIHSLAGQGHQDARRNNRGQHRTFYQLGLHGFKTSF